MTTLERHHSIVAKLTREKWLSLPEIFPAKMIQDLQGHYLWGWLDVRLLEGFYHLRKKAGFPIFINRNGGQFSGFRPSWSTVGAVYSGHRVGMALDLKTATPGQLEILIQLVMAYGLQWGFTEIENPERTPGWLHVSTRAHSGSGLRIVNP